MIASRKILLTSFNAQPLSTVSGNDKLEARGMDAPLDRQRFDELVLHHLPAAQQFAVRLTGRPELAEDVVQEAMLRAARGRRTFRGEARFKTWLFQIVVNCFRDWLASRRHDESLPEKLTDRNENIAFAHASGAEIGELVARAVSTLPPRQREVLVLVAYERFSTEEAAEAIGISVGNVRVNLHLARERLRELLKDVLPEVSRER